MNGKPARCEESTLHRTTQYLNSVCIMIGSCCDNYDAYMRYEYDVYLSLRGVYAYMIPR